MKDKTKKVLSLILCLLTVLSFTACGSSESENSKKTEVPTEIAKVRDAAMKAAQDTAKDFEGYWVDRVANLVLYYTDDTVKQTSEYTALQVDLATHVTSTGASSMYVLVPNEENIFRVTVSTEAKSWLEETESNPIYDEAYKKGFIASEKSGWTYDNKHCWTAYSPLYNQSGEIYAILAVNYPADVLSEYPEWDRTSDSWNEFE